MINEGGDEPCLRQEHWIWPPASADRFAKMKFSPLLTSNVSISFASLSVVVCVRGERERERERLEFVRVFVCD